MKNLTEGNIYKTFILFAIPMVLSGVLSQGYNLIDTMIAGRYLGDAGLAAVGASSPFISFVSAIFWGYNGGFAMYIAKLFGSRDYKELKAVVCNNIVLNLVVAFFVSMIIILLGEQIIEILKVDEAIRSQAESYLAIYIAGLFFIMMTYNFAFILNALGSGGFPFIVSLLSAVLNIGGNILSVAVMEWGVKGIAASTVFAAIVADIFYTFKLRKCFKELGVGKEQVSLRFSTIKSTFTYAIPTTFQQMMIYVATMLLSPMINAIGSAATASYNVITKIYDINANIYQNSAKTLGNYTAQSVGAGKFGNLKRGVRVGFIQGLLFLLPPLILCVVFAEPMCRLFFPENETGESLMYSVQFVKYFLPLVAFNLINNLFHAFFRGAGLMRFLLVSTTLGSVSRLVYTLILVGYGMYGVYIGWALSWITEAVFVLWIYFSGRWKKNFVMS